MTSGTQTAWLAAGSVLTIGAFGWGAFNVVDLLAHEVRTVTEVVDAEGVSMIDIDNSNGRVVITGTDTDEITIVARISDGLRATGNSTRVVDDRLEIRGTCPLLGSMWCSVDYRIEVPAGVDLDINVDEDRVEVVDMRGASDDRRRQRFDRDPRRRRTAAGHDRQRQHRTRPASARRRFRRQRQRLGRDRDGHAAAAVAGNHRQRQRRGGAPRHAGHLRRRASTPTTATSATTSAPIPRVAARSPSHPTTAM